jgi:hypothetical protein
MKISFLSLIAVVVVGFFVVYGSSTIQSFNSDNLLKEMEVGEEITYVVRYGFIKLGEVKLKILNRKTVNSKHVYSTIAYIDSYSGIPFVDLHQIYYSKVNNSFYSDYFRGLVRKKTYTTFTEYFFDYQNSQLRVKKGKVEPEELWTDSTTYTESMLHDGLSIFYYARMNTGKKKSESLPCFVNEEKVFTKVNFYDKVEKLNIDAVDYDIAVVRLDGETDFISVFGLTGYFEGWFSNDEAAVPIIAKMKVIIGNVTLELKSWKKEGWIPPKYQG